MSKFWTDEQCAKYFGHGRRMNLATRDETLAAIREGTKRYQEKLKRVTI